MAEPAALTVWKASGVCRFCPVLARTVVRYSTSMPMNLSPLRRSTLIIMRPTNRVNAFDRDGAGVSDPAGPARSLFKAHGACLPFRDCAGMCAVAAQPRTGLTPTIPTPSVVSGIG